MIDVIGRLYIARALWLFMKTLGALPLDPSRGLSRFALSAPFLLPFSVRGISLCAVYEPAVRAVSTITEHMVTAAM